MEDAIATNSYALYAELEPQRLETEENQQIVLANQSEFTLGYRLSEKTTSVSTSAFNFSPRRLSVQFAMGDLSTFVLWNSERRD
jgi:hypothetical protein